MVWSLWQQRVDLESCALVRVKALVYRVFYCTVCSAHCTACMHSIAKQRMLPHP
jgi:hypothetical protein